MVGAQMALGGKERRNGGRRWRDLVEEWWERRRGYKDSGGVGDDIVQRHAESPTYATSRLSVYSISCCAAQQHDSGYTRYWVMLTLHAQHWPAWVYRA